jgi:hypothetical protein
MGSKIEGLAGLMTSSSSEGCAYRGVHMQKGMIIINAAPALTLMIMPDICIAFAAHGPAHGMLRTSILSMASPLPTHIATPSGPSPSLTNPSLNIKSRIAGDVV